MSPRLLYELMSVLQAMHQGRTHAAAEALAKVIREHGGTAPSAHPLQQEPAPTKKPIWMERGA